MVIKFIKRLVYFFMICFTAIAVLVLVSNNYILNKYPKQGQTEANLFHINKNEKYSNVILGISHGRNFSRGVHHQMLEEKKGKCINLAIGNSLSGLKSQRIYLEYFFEKGNSADTALLVLSPPMVYNSHTDQVDIAYYQEPLRFDYLKKIWKDGTTNKYSQIFHYSKSKLGHHWWHPTWHSMNPNKRTLSEIDSTAMREGIVLAYPYGLSKTEFDISTQDLDRLIAVCTAHHTTIKVIIPPALFGRWPGHEAILSYMHNKYPNMPISDLSLRILDPKLYQDHHHLNTEGIKLILTMI